MSSGGDNSVGNLGMPEGIKPQPEEVEHPENVVPEDEASSAPSPIQTNPAVPESVNPDPIGPATNSQRQEGSRHVEGSRGVNDPTKNIIYDMLDQMSR